MVLLQIGVLLTLLTNCYGQVKGGHPAAKGEIPYIVSLRINGEHACGAAILDEKHVLTAAHCIVRVTADILTIQYDVVNRLTQKGNVVNVQSIIRHEEYKITNSKLVQYHDLAILKLEKSIKLGKTVKAIKLPKPNTRTPENSVATISGWGLKEHKTKKSVSHLQVAKVKIYPDRDCAKIQKINTKYQLCAWNPEYQSGSGLGDSGGPLIVEESGSKVLVGIVSGGPICKCEGLLEKEKCEWDCEPAKFVKISNYITWIQQKLNRKVHNEL